MTITETTNPADNGVNVEALLGAREAMTEVRPAAQFKWQVSHEWVSGAHGRSIVKDFFGLGETQERPKQFVLETDHPELFAAGDNGPTPLEVVLCGLAGCLTAGVASVAQHRNIQLNSVVATLEGDMDMAGVLGIDSDVRNGFGAIRVTYNIDADATREEIEAIVAQSQKRSAVYDVIANPTNISVEVA